MTDLVAALAAACPVDPGGDADLDRALAFAGLEWSGRQVRRAATGALLLGGAVGATLLVTATFLAPSWAVPVAGGSLLVASSAAYALLAGPEWLADARRARALGDLPDLVGLAALRLRVTPTPESAAAFATEHGRDPLAASLREHVRRARGTGASGWEGFLAAWGEADASLGRSVSLLGAAADATDDDRRRLANRALDAALDGTRERAATFATSIRGPTGAVYAFGVVVPLALVGALPAARAAGVPVGVAWIVAVYDLLLPATLLAASGWLLGRRPVAFPPAPVPPDHPDLPRWRRFAPAFGVLAGGVGWLACGALPVPPWTRWVVAPGAGAGVALFGWYGPVADVRERVADVEAGLPDALALVGRRIQRGEPAEAAVAGVASSLSGPVATVFAEAARVQSTLRVGVRDAFLGPRGALADVPSPRARSAATLLAHAASEGPHGGRVLVEVADHVEDLLAVERDARRDLAGVAGTLRNTAWCFGPLIGGVTVALSSRLGGGTTAGALQPVPTGTLGLAVGVYVLAIAAILSALAAGLEYGLDRALLGRRVGAALLGASVVYPVAVAVAGLAV